MKEPTELPSMIIGIDAHAAENDGTGNCTYIRNLLSGLKDIDKSNRYVLYVTNKNHSFYNSFQSADNFTTVQIPVKNPLLRIPLFLAGATFLDSLDLLHVQYNSPIFHKGRLIVTIHDLGFLHYPEYFSKLETWRLKILTKFTARKSSKIITGSHYSKNDIAEKLKINRDKIAVTPYGISPYLRSDLNAQKEDSVLNRYHIKKPYFLSVGRLNPRKNLLTLVRAFNKAKQIKSFPHKLVIAGKSDFKTSAIRESISSEQKNDDIIFTGFIRDEDLPYLYKSAGLFIYPSLFEGVGLPVLEAMKSGVPVIASNTSSLKEIVADAGITVNPLDIDEISQAILRLITQPDLAQSYKKKGRQNAEKHTPIKMARATLGIYQNNPT